MPINERGEFIRESDAPEREVLPQDSGAKTEKVKQWKEKLEKLRRHHSDMKFDLENGRYPQGVPSEYHTEMEETQREIEQLEDSIEQESKDISES
jgi:hypothetical protein